MTQDQYYSSSIDEYTLLDSTINTGCDFNKYDPYVEKIRTLFVPSLESRIYSCLETFVYPENPKASSGSAYLKRCLDATATWREPVDGFSNRLEDRGFVEKMLAQAVKYFVKDGLIDCFINSIVLNNRLSKVAKNLDAMGFEKNFLRYLAVWNYINERDYWIDDHERMSPSLSDSSCDSIDSHSDLDVQVGSGLDTQRTERRFKKALKRRASDDSSEFVWQHGNDFSENRDEATTSNLQFSRRFDINSTDPNTSKSNVARKKPRSIKKKPSCRPSNCPTYATKNRQQCDWRGKTLKLRVRKICPPTDEHGPANPTRLSKLPLPCTFDDVIAKIVEADTCVPRSSSIATTKKLQSGVTNICRCVNVTLERMSRDEVRRCRLRCEILPGCVGFKMVRRQSNGCKVCLFTDRVATERIDGQSTPREYFVGRKANISKDISCECDVSIVSEGRVDSIDENLRIGSSIRTETDIGTDQRPKTSLRSRESTLDATDRRNSDELGEEEVLDRSNGKTVSDQTRCCNSSLVVELEYSDNRVEEKPENSLREGSEVRVDKGDRIEIPEIVAVENSSGNGVCDQTCGCDSSLVVGAEYLDDKVEGSSETSLKNESGVTMDQEGTTKISGNVVFNESSRNGVDDRTGFCNNSEDSKPDDSDREPVKLQDSNLVGSFDDARTQRPEKGSTTKDFSNHFTAAKSEDQASCLCDTSLPENIDTNNYSEENKEFDCTECLENSVKNAVDPNRQNSDGPEVISNSQRIRRADDAKVDSDFGVVPNDRRVSMSSLKASSSCSKTKSLNSIERGISQDDVRCECPSDSCACTNKRKDGDEVRECASQCSCDSCDAPDALTLTNGFSDPARVPPSNNLPGPSKTDSRASNPTKPTLSDASNDKWRPDCAESRTNSWESHHLGFHRNASSKSKISFRSNVKNPPLADTNAKVICCDEKNSKYPQFKTAKPASSDVEESTKKSSMGKSPIRMDTERGSSAKSQRINISIELCSESVSSREEIFSNERKMISTLWRNNTMRSRCPEDRSVVRKSRCGSVDTTIDGTRAISQLEKNMENECLRHFRRMNLHSPIRPMESRRRPSLLEPSSGMRNLDVDGISTKSAVSPACKFERRSTRKLDDPKIGASKYSNLNGDAHRSNHEIPESPRIVRPNEFPKNLRRTTTRFEKTSPSVIRNNLCHAFSASSIDRMKHLIKTKLRRILLERDKATNTPKTSLTNKNYRISVANGKTKRLPFSKKRCHTIWECRSESDSARTSTTCRSIGRTSFVGVARGDEAKSLRSKPSPGVSTAKPKNLENCCNFDGTNNETSYNSIGSDRSVVSSGITIGPRLVGGSDAPRQNVIDSEFRYSWKQRRKIIENYTNEKFEYRSDFRDVTLGMKNSNRVLTNDSKVPIDASANVPRFENTVDCNGEAALDECRNKILKFPGKLDWSGNSTSTHIYLHDYENYESLNDEYENNCVHRKICNQNNNINKLQNNNHKKSQELHLKNCKEIKHRPHTRQYNGKSNGSRNIRRTSSSRMQPTSDVRWQTGFGKIDRDLRSKLSQYVSLCKNVKYSLLKLLRPVDVDDFSRTSTACCD